LLRVGRHRAKTQQSSYRQQGVEPQRAAADMDAIH